jgi:hypothetical protein
LVVQGSCVARGGGGGGGAVLTVIIKHNPTTSCRLSLMQRNTQTIGRQIGSLLSALAAQSTKHTTSEAIKSSFHTCLKKQKN